jgi:hypothetical protein
MLDLVALCVIAVLAGVGAVSLIVLIALWVEL